MHVAIHVMNRMVAIVASDPVEDWPSEVPSGVHVHLWPLVLAQNDVLTGLLS